jgi:PPM family protein phosphatase
VAVAVLVLLVVGGIGTYMWALDHWFVGVHDSGATEEVAIFRGVDASVVGLNLYRLDETTDLSLSDLEPAARNRVRGGIAAVDPSDAARILDALRAQRLPLCPSQDTTANGSSATTSATPTPPQPAGGTPAVATTAPSAATHPTPPSDSASGTAGTSGSSATRTTASLEPGEDCREAK